MGALQPALLRLGERYAKVTLVVDSAYKDLLQGGDNQVNELVFYPRAEINQASFVKKLSKYWQFIAQLRKVNFDVVVDVEADSTTSNLAYFSRGEYKIGPWNATRSFYDEICGAKSSPHEFVKYRDVLNKVVNVEGLKPQYANMEIDCNETHPLAQDGTLVLIHVGATKPRKMWPLDKWCTLIEKLKASGYTPCLVGAGKIDRQAIQEICSRMEVDSLCDQLTLAQLMALMKQACFYIGNDSGPMHLASAVGVPALGLFGPSSESIWGPIAATTRTLRAYECPASCGGRHSCDLNHGCIRDLAVDDVWDAFVSYVT